MLDLLDVEATCTIVPLLFVLELQSGREWLYKQGSRMKRRSHLPPGLDAGKYGVVGILLGFYLVIACVESIKRESACLQELS